MSNPDLPHRTEPTAGESESVSSPHSDEKPPRRRLLTQVSFPLS